MFRMRVIMRKIAILLYFVSLAGLASPYPVITSLDVDYTSDGAFYNITQKVVDVGPSADRIFPVGGNVSLFHKHTNNGGISYYAAPAVTDQNPGDGKQSIGTLALKFYNEIGKNINQIHHVGDNGFAECVAYGGAPYSPQGATDWNNVWLPGGCIMVPPSDEWCKITTPQITLEHGTITLQQAEGDKASSSLGVQCTAATAVSFNLITKDKYVYLDEGKSEITVDDQPLYSKIDLPQGDSQMPITDLLTGVTKEGFHTGSSVLVMMPY